jgi:hypothetical protein
MALKDLKSNLRNLKFDKDTPGGGSSGLPYIKGGLPEDSPAGEYIADLARYSSNGAVRGGLFSVVSSTTDTVRISRFLNDFPKGLLFTSKQIGLAKSNPKIETGTRGDVLNTQVYNLNSNLLAQVANQGTGEHIPYYGFNTNNLRNDENKYEEIVKKKSTDENRLVTLYNNKILSTPPSGIINDLKELGIPDNNKNVLFNYEGGPGSSYGDGVTFIPRVVDTVNSYDDYRRPGFTKSSYRPVFKILSEDKPYTSSYIASLYNNSNLDSFIQASILETTLGIPNDTQAVNTIRDDFNFEDNTLYQQSSPDFIRAESNPVGISPINQFGNTMAYSTLIASKKYIEQGELQDFRQKSIEFNGQETDYSKELVNIATRLNIGNPGSRTREQRQYLNQTNNGDGQDKINLIPLYTSTGDPIQDNKVRDMIKFCIEVINNDSPEKTSPLHFRAYVTDFSDNIGADWNGQKYMGRGENFYTYQGFTREVSFKLTVAAQSKQEMMPLYQKLNFLASSLHPDYSSGGFMRGNLHKLTIGEWFYRTPGILKSMNISIDNQYPWEIKYTEPETDKFPTSDFPTNVSPSNYKNGTSDKGSENFENSNSDADMMELPQILSISFTFTPILNNLPRLAKDNNSKFTQTPILISDHGIQENFIKRITN